MNTINYSRTFRQLVAGLGLALLAACAHGPRYAEPTLPENQLGVLECTAPVWIVSLDGQRVSTSVFSDLTRIRVSSGPHRVELAYRGTASHTAPPPPLHGAINNAGEISSSIHQNTDVNTFSLHNVTLDFVAKPGFTYAVRGGIGANSWNPSISESPRP